MNLVFLCLKTKDIRYHLNSFFLKWCTLTYTRKFQIVKKKIDSVRFQSKFGSFSRKTRIAPTFLSFHTNSENV